ncbi:MAG: hypothetical protein HQ567_07070 [Candidatus Nealsonbacteria bacterium]|nr:hypothetical protein [Candidatus Nealsonbacteria bacterium]
MRGYAATMAEIEETVATPYMGFNLGSTKMRQNYKDDVVRFIFESPLLRLMKDEQYVDAYHGGDFTAVDERVDAKSIWIFRYYEEASKDLGGGKRKTIPEFALQLRKFILRVRSQVCGDDAAELARFKVYLVAHSMGGLVCRCYLQNTCRNVPDSTLELPGDPLVDKVFTYATPHNGIDLVGFNAPDLGSLDRVHVRNFNRTYMRKYLDISSDDVPLTSLDGAFPTERFFCFVGTNYRDYEAFHRLSKRATGPMSDGLVMMENASVYQAPRAFAHRSHSGHYGIVNSEEGYQNLRRFLFGQVRVDARLAADEITLPAAVQREKDKGKKIRARYNIEVAAKVRNAGCFLNERKVSQESAIRRPYEDMVKKQLPVYLFTGYLHRAGKSDDPQDTALAFAIQIGVEVPLFEVDNRFWFDDHFEGERLLLETVTFHLRHRAGRTTVRYGLASESGVGQANRMATINGPDAQGRMRIEIPLGFKKGAANPPRPGFRGRLLLTARPWN